MGARAVVSAAGVPPDDTIRRAQQGDVAAFESLYHAHAPAVLALCRRMVRDDGEAGELVQDVFVRAWERLASFRGESALSTWLHRIAVNVVLERARTAKREWSRWIEHEDDDPAAAAPETHEDARMDLDTAISDLPRGARLVFVLHDVQGYSHEEIASIIGISAATARVQLFRARRALMKVLER